MPTDLASSLKRERALAQASRPEQGASFTDWILPVQCPGGEERPMGRGPAGSENEGLPVAQSGTSRAD